MSMIIFTFASIILFSIGLHYYIVRAERVRMENLQKVNIAKRQIVTLENVTLTADNRFFTKTIVDTLNHRFEQLNNIIKQYGGNRHIITPLVYSNEALLFTPLNTPVDTKNEAMKLSRDAYLLKQTLEKERLLNTRNATSIEKDIQYLTDCIFTLNLKLLSMKASAAFANGDLFNAKGAYQKLLETIHAQPDKLQVFDSLVCDVRNKLASIDNTIAHKQKEIHMPSLQNNSQTQMTTASDSGSGGDKTSGHQSPLTAKKNDYPDSASTDGLDRVWSNERPKYII